MVADPEKQQGLNPNKWIVFKANDTKHDKCVFFVLDLHHDKFAKSALEAYVEACRGEYPLLANDMIKQYGLVVADVFADGGPRTLQQQIFEYVRHAVRRYGSRVKAAKVLQVSRDRIARILGTQR